MNRISKYLLFISFGIAALTSSCISTTSDDIDKAEIALENDNPGKASKICNLILDRQVSAQEKDVDLLCRMAILYMKISDEFESSENIGYAVQCFQLAYACDSMAASEFFNSIPVEDMAQSAMLKQIVKSTNQHTSDSIKITDKMFIDEPDSASFSYDSIQ